MLWLPDFVVVDFIAPVEPLHWGLAYKLMLRTKAKR